MSADETLAGTSQVDTDRLTVPGACTVSAAAYGAGGRYRLDAAFQEVPERRLHHPRGTIPGPVSHLSRGTILRQYAPDLVSDEGVVRRSDVQRLLR